MTKSPKLILSCVHAANYIPPAYRKLLAPNRVLRGPWGRRNVNDLLNDHWGWDPGALDLARHLARRCSAPLFVFPVSRLLIEPDGHIRTSFFSPLTGGLSREKKDEIIERYWRPYVNSVERAITKETNKGKRVVHVVVHSFTPVWKAAVRKCDIGILFDPRRAQEKEIAMKLQREVKKRLPKYLIRRNYPHRGRSEGHTTYMRMRFPGNQYAGIEIEVNQKHISRRTARGARITRALAEALQEILL